MLSAQRQGGGAKPRSAVEAFEIADDQTPEVDPRRQAGPAHRRRVEPGADLLDEAVKVMGAQDLVDRLVVRVRPGRRQVGSAEKQRLLNGLAFAKGHGESTPVEDVGHDSASGSGHQGKGDFHHGLLTAGIKQSGDLPESRPVGDGAVATELRQLRDILEKTATFFAKERS